MAEPSERDRELARAAWERRKGGSDFRGIIEEIAAVVADARDEGRHEERERCVDILHDEGWIGRSEQRIAHPNLFTEQPSTTAEAIAEEIKRDV